MNRLRPRGPRSLEQLLDDEVALGCCQAAEREGLVGVRRMQGAAVGVGVHRDRADAELSERPEDPDGDLAAVRNEDFPEHTPYSPDR